MRATAAAVCDALACVIDGKYADAAILLHDVSPGLDSLGGSAAQREVLEETLLLCLVRDGQIEVARQLLDGRLARRPSPLDGRRRDLLAASPLGSDALC